MKLYHRTHACEAILRDGFRDTTDTYGMNRPCTGVWLSEEPLSFYEGAKGDMLLVIEVPRRTVEEWEVVEEGKPYRRFLIPAEIVNRHGQPKVVAEEEEERILASLWAARTEARLSAISAAEREKQEAEIEKPRQSSGKGKG
ncbi:MAG: hypothetical protein QGI83_20100 [Candidatus Latescibacteria bacterium]|jgi:hypothetical protein|nr:hypothetical protein [Rhodospirillaceae bacterium]MDP6779068.1 hypothetical protein [Candidatus Latescibacterota bacterium]